MEFPEYIAHCTGGDFHQIYKRNPSGDSAEEISYVNLHPDRIFKTKEACEAEILKIAVLEGTTHSGGKVTRGGV